MAHNVKFDKSTSKLSGLLTEQEIIDIIDMFYRFDDCNFYITCHIDRPRKGLRGQQQYNSIMKLHTIYLSPDNIRQGFDEKSRMGGNMLAPTLKMGVVMVLAHELQHANQALLHGNTPDTYMFRHVPFQKYKARPCEKDARSFVDDNMDQIAAICDVKLEDHKLDNVIDLDDEELENELEDLADVLGELEEVHVRDINEELRSLRLNNAKNVGVVKELLKERGVKVSH